MKHNQTDKGVINKQKRKGDVIMDRSSFSKTAASRNKMKGMSGRKEEGSIK